MVTILADNYFGYCKKEVKTQIGYSANLFGLAEEEHAGGALAFATFNLGDRFVPEQVRIVSANHRFARGAGAAGPARDVPRRRATPPTRSIPRSTTCRRTWRSTSTGRTSPGPATGEEQHLKLLPGRDLHPSERLQGPDGQAPRGAELAAGRHGARGRLLPQAVHRLGRRQVGDQQEPGRRHALRAVLRRGASRRTWRWSRRSSTATTTTRGCPSCARRRREPVAADPLARALARLGDQAAHAQSRRVHARVQRLAARPSPTTSARWCSSSSASTGRSGATIGAATSASTSSTARPGTSSSTRAASWSATTCASGARRTAPGAPSSCGRTSSRPTRCRWRTTSPPRSWCRRAGSSASPASTTATRASSWSQNCEFRLFQRPDDAIHPGLDRQTEADMAGPGLFCSNFEPLDPRRRAATSSRTWRVHDAFTAPMREHVAANAARARRRLLDLLGAARGWSTASPPRTRATCSSARTSRTRATATSRRWAPGSTAGCRSHAPVLFPVISVLSGRRNNRPEEGIRPLCVYGPIHYQELPELFMDYVCSLTGKSPSTTGAGSEGALTKGPFNALAPTADLNNALVSMLLTGYGGFSSAAGFIGPRYRVDHDISLLIPEIWCRLFPHERDPRRLIEAGHLEQLEDFEFDGQRGARQPARLPHHGQVRAHLLRAGVRQPHRGLHRGDPAARDAGSGGLRRRREQHRRGAAAGGGGVLRGRHHRGRLPAAQGAAPHHGPRAVRGERRPPSRDPRALHAARRCSRATGTRSGSRSSSSATWRSGSGTCGA